jgi:mRNA interferase YafQ
MLETVITTGFKHNYKKALKQRKKIEKLDEIIRKLSAEIPLDIKHKNHKLVGNYVGKWECHIEPDWLLVYEIINNRLVLHATGSHSELFSK